jgi:uncharacterized protein with NRDE domain
MCLILLAYRFHPTYPLILAANRDEFPDRPTAAASFWDTEPPILGGRDLQSGGTWLGITRTGRIAALANFRESRAPMKDSPSRGGLVTHYLQGQSPPGEHLETLRRNAAAYNGFGMVFGDRESLCFFSNRGEAPPHIRPGIHGLSNHLLDTPWPKVEQGRKALADLLKADAEQSAEELFALLTDSRKPADDLLPDTGVGIERERYLSPLFIEGPGYCTRSSTVVLMGSDSRVFFAERTYNGNTHQYTEVRFSFTIL